MKEHKIEIYKVDEDASYAYNSYEYAANMEGPVKEDYRRLPNTPFIKPIDHDTTDEELVEYVRAISESNPLVVQGDIIRIDEYRSYYVNGKGCVRLEDGFFGNYIGDGEYYD